MHPYLPHLQWIESQSESMKALVIKWTLINSWSDNLNGLDTMLSTLMEDFARLQGEMQRITLPSRQVIEKKGNRIVKALGQALSIKKRPQAPIQILLAGHMDTVYPPTHPLQGIEQHQEILKGPGVTDMKGGLVILLTVLEALERSPFSSSIGWEVLINPDEEIGSPGSHFLFQNAAKRHQIGLIFEPSFPDGAFVSQRKGSANYTVIVKGRTAHAGRDFHLGCNAIYALTQFVYELEKWHLEHKEITVNVGYVEGGGVLNIVPDYAMCRLNIRAHTVEKMRDATQSLQHLIHVIQRREGIHCTLIEETLRVPKPLDEKTQQLFDLYHICADQLHIPFQLRESGGVCDGNILSAAGLPTLDSVGVVGGKIHTEEEYMELPSLVERAKLAALFLFKLPAGEIFLNHSPYTNTKD